MKICKHQFEYAYTIDKELPFGEIESKAVYKCRICGEEYVQQDSDIKDAE